jgi:hypothetical protein
MVGREGDEGAVVVMWQWSLAPSAEAQIGQEGVAGAGGLRHGRIGAVGPDVLRQI